MPTTYLVRLYSPYTLKTFAKRVDAISQEEAKKKIVGTIVVDPDGYEFIVESYFVISVAPIVALPRPPYELMDEEEAKEAEWLKGAIVPEPLAKGSTPVGSPKLETEIPDALTSIIFGQEVRSRSIRFLEDYPKFKIGTREYGPYSKGDVEHKLPWKTARLLCAVKFRVLKSPPLTPLIDPTGKALREGEEVYYSEPEHLSWAKLQVSKGNLEQITEPVAEWLYPEYKAKIKYRIDIHTKFLEEAKRMRKLGKIKEAVEYLITYSMGIPLAYLAQILILGYWTTWRAVAELARPTEVQLKRIMETLDETATLEKWTKGQEEEIVLTLKAPKEPKVGLGYWHDRVVCYPLKPLPETALFQELKRILTLEGYPTLTREEEEALEKQMKEYYEKKARERLTYWIK
jgi:hypothetical protein